MIAIETKMIIIIDITISSSTNVNPFCLYFLCTVFVFFLGLIIYGNRAQAKY